MDREIEKKQRVWNRVLSFRGSIPSTFSETDSSIPPRRKSASTVSLQDANDMGFSLFDEYKCDMICDAMDDGLSEESECDSVDERVPINLENTSRTSVNDIDRCAELIAEVKMTMQQVACQSMDLSSSAGDFVLKAQEQEREGEKMMQRLQNLAAFDKLQEKAAEESRRSARKKKAKKKTAASSNLLLLDVCPLTIGIVNNNGVIIPIIHRNTTIPCKKTVTAYATVDAETQVLITVFEGESVLARRNNEIGALVIDSFTSSNRSMFTYLLCSLMQEQVILTASNDFSAIK